jgi:hypothetical protein
MPCSNFSDRESWLAARSAPSADGFAMIGASDVATIFGLGFVAPARFAAQKRGQMLKDIEAMAANDPRAVGLRLESAALAEYEVHHPIPDGCQLGTAITRWTHPNVPWLAVSPDAGIVAEDQRVLGLVQAKIPRSAGALQDYAPDAPDGYGLAATLADPRGPAVPRAYALQCLVELGTIRANGAPADFIDLWCWPSPHAHRRVRLVWDDGADAAFAALIDTIGKWRQRHIIEGLPVPIGCPDDAAVAVRLWAAEGQHVAPGLARLAREYVAATEAEKAAQVAKEEARVLLLATLEAHEAATVIVPDPSADPGAKRKADREGNPAKVAITGKLGGVRSLRVSPGWLADADLAALAHDPRTPPVPVQIDGVTVGQVAARWADEPAAPALSAEDAALLADVLGSL